MSDPQSAPSATTAATTIDACSRCAAALTPETRVLAAGRAFCRMCYDALRAELAQGIASMSENINWPMAVLGAVLGAAAGALAWWGFTALTGWSVGLVAVAIGVLTAMGAVRFAGNKRSRGIQLLSIGVSIASFVVATYLVHRTSINRILSEQQDPRRVGLIPASLSQFVGVSGMNAGIMDVVFLAIVIYEAWRVAAPARLPGAGRS